MLSQAGRRSRPSDSRRMRGNDRCRGCLPYMEGISESGEASSTRPDGYDAVRGSGRRWRAENPGGRHRQSCLARSRSLPDEVRTLLDALEQQRPRPQRQAIACHLEEALLVDAAPVGKEAQVDVMRNRVAPIS